MTTTPLLPLTPPTSVSPSAGTKASLSAAGFAESLGGMLGNVEATSAQANVAVGRMLDGTGDVHEAMIALQRAETTFQVTVQVRNRLVQAYQDIMRMPV